MTQLSPEQFRLFNPGPRSAVFPQPGEQDDRPLDSNEDYGGRSGAHYANSHWESAEGPREHWAPNPLSPTSREQAQSMWNTPARDFGGSPNFVDTWVNPGRVFSSQSQVNPRAIDHMVKHANPLALSGDDPVVTPFKDLDGSESYEVADGNHRVNAAQRRGQLLMPVRLQT